MKKMEYVKYVKRISGISLLAMIVTACGFEESELEKQRNADDGIIKEHLAEHDISATRDPSGLYYAVIHENPDGEPVTTDDIVSIYYSMKTLEGVEIEKTTDSLAPARFVHNYQSVIPLGLDYAVHLMKVGEKFRFYMPSVLAYDKYYSDGKFGPNTNFIIDVEVVDILDEADINQAEKDSIQNYITKSEIEGIEPLSSGLFYKTLEEGDGSSPSSYSRVTFHFKRSYLDSTVIEKTDADHPVTIPLNSGYAVEGLEEGLMRMKKGGKSLLIMPSEIAFGSSIQILPSFMRDELIENNVLQAKVQPFSPVVYEVELVDFY